MGRKGSRRRRNFIGNTNSGNTLVALKPPPAPMRKPPQSTTAIPFPQRHEPLVRAASAMQASLPDQIAPLPRNMSLVDPNQPMTRRLRNWLVGLAEHWAARHKPLPEAPTMAQLDKLRKELASVQRKLDRMLG
jgi:hypothetical protein